MDMMFFLFAAVVIIIAVYSDSSNEKEIQKYIARRKGEFVSKKKEYFDLQSIFTQYQFL
jgi:hypothetical protein